MQAIAALGHCVAMVSPERDHFAKITPRDKIPFSRIRHLSVGRFHKRPLLNAPMRAFALASALIRHKGYDVVFCRGRFAETPGMDMLLARAFGRTVYTIEHSPSAAEWPFLMSKRRYGRVMGRCLRRVITVSAEIAEIAAREFQISADKLCICRNWVDPGFHPVSEDRRRLARQRLGLPQDSTVIGYLGRLSADKRVDVLIEAFRQHLARQEQSSSVLMIAGEGSSRAALQEQARLAGIDHQVRFVGWQTDPRDVLELLDLFVLPSLVEGFPLALMEAMSSGLACLAHPMSSTGELIESGRNGILVDMSGPELLADELTKLQDAGRSHWMAMGQAAAGTIGQCFSRDIRLHAVLGALDIALDVADVPPPYNRAMEYQAGKAKPRGKPLSSSTEGMVGDAGIEPATPPV
ncbi:glycosyltransferase [Mesorhizobium sp.]|uniref:glycosyltransferase n=1 Tax=Mesorhizobium sp. TaxID=1871066 RepID=UPI003422AAB6